MTSYYVYAIQPTQTELPRHLRGFHDGALSRLCWRDLAAVVAQHDIPDISPTPERVRRHHQVVSQLRELGPALPVRFGTIFSDGDALTRSIKQRYSVLRSDMERLDGKVEYGITALWGTCLEDRDLEPEPERSEEPDTPGSQYMHRRLEEYQRETALRRIVDEIVSDVERALSPVSNDNALTPLPSLEIPVRGSFLVDEPRSADFEQAFQDLRQRYPTLRFLLVGPWPPYSFVSSNDELDPGTFGANSLLG